MNQNGVTVFVYGVRRLQAQLRSLLRTLASRQKSRATCIAGEEGTFFVALSKSRLFCCVCRQYSLSVRCAEVFPTISTNNSRATPCKTSDGSRPGAAS